MLPSPLTEIEEGNKLLSITYPRNAQKRVAVGVAAHAFQGLTPAPYRNQSINYTKCAV